MGRAIGWGCHFYGGGFDESRKGVIVGGDNGKFFSGRLHGIQTANGSGFHCELEASIGLRVGHGTGFRRL